MQLKCLVSLGSVITGCKRLLCRLVDPSEHLDLMFQGKRMASERCSPSKIYSTRKKPPYESAIKFNLEPLAWAQNQKQLLSNPAFPGWGVENLNISTVTKRHMCRVGQDRVWDV